MIAAPKKKNRYTKSGAITGKHQLIKAIVTLKEGETIDFTVIFKL